jgi:hypothetical protein
MAPRGLQEFSYKVRNTFVEFSPPAENETVAARGKRRTRSDVDKRKSPLMNVQNSPLLHSVDETLQAIPIDEANFDTLEEAATPSVNESSSPSTSLAHDQSHDVWAPYMQKGNDPAYIMPATPSPFMHSAFAPSMVPPFEGQGYGFGASEMGLPPAFGMEGECYFGMFGPEAMDPYNMPMDPYNMPMGYDPSFEQYMQTVMPCPWPGPGMPVAAEEGEGGNGGGGDCFVGLGMEDVATQEHATAGGTSDMPKEEGSSRRKKGHRETTEATNGGNSETTPDAGGKNTESKAASASGAGRGGSNGGGSAAHGKVSGGAEDAGDAEPPPTDYTTVMLRNIPNKYTREMLVKQLSIEFLGEFDFMYLPIDFKNKCNVGYCFINFRSVEACSRFETQFHGVNVRTCLPGLNSRKVAEVTPARVQGCSENVSRLRNSPVMNQLQEHPEWMPLIFKADGELEPFPSPEQPLPPVKQRGRGRQRLSLPENST